MYSAEHHLVQQYQEWLNDLTEGPESDEEQEQQEVQAIVDGVTKPKCLGGWVFVAGAVGVLAAVFAKLSAEAAEDDVQINLFHVICSCTVA